MLVTMACAPTPTSVAAPRAMPTVSAVLLNAEARERGQMLVDRSVVPETVLATTDTAVARLDWIAGAFVPLGNRAGVVCHRAAAAHLVKAIAFARVFVVKGLDEEAGIIIGAAIAGGVNAAAVEFAWGGPWLSSSGVDPSTSR